MGSDPHSGGRGSEDCWARWLLHDRFAGDDSAVARTMRELEPVRDRVLDAARIREGEAVIDVGCGDGLLGFGALDRTGPDGTVVFAEPSSELLDVCRRIASRLSAVDRCQFVQTRAEHLDGIDRASVDAVVMRSVLIYVDDKQAAFDAFRRVLRAGGRLSLFEPLASRSRGLGVSLWGYDARSVRDLAGRLRARLTAAAGGERGSMLGFDDLDLVACAERAGFERIRARSETVQRSSAHLGPTDWNSFLQLRVNPRAPTAGEVIAAELDEREQGRLRAALEPQVTSGSGRWFSTACYFDAEAP